MKTFLARWRRYLLLLILLGSSLGVGSAVAADYVTILIYHRFGDQRYPTTNVSTEAFAEQMAYLHDNGYHVISLADLVTLMKNKIKLQPKTVVITIDDGYKSVYENGWPILQKYNFPFTVFLYTEGLEKEYSNYMTWAQIKEMRDQGVDFQDHGFGHKHMAFKPEGVDEIGYRAWISSDLRRSMAIMSRNLGEMPRFFAVPYGEYNSILLDEAKKVGYEAVLIQDPGAVSDDTDIFALPRQPILGKEWATMAHFKKILKAADLPLADLNPEPQQLAEPLVTKFSARMLYPERYVNGTFGFWVSGLGWHPAKRQGDTLSFSTDKPLTRMVNRVVVSGREKKSKKLATRTWMLIHPDAKGEL